MVPRKPNRLVIFNLLNEHLLNSDGLTLCIFAEFHSPPSKSSCWAKMTNSAKYPSRNVQIGGQMRSPDGCPCWTHLDIVCQAKFWRNSKPLKLCFAVTQNTTLLNQGVQSAIQLTFSVLNYKPRMNQSSCVRVSFTIDQRNWVLDI